MMTRTSKLIFITILIAYLPSAFALTYYYKNMSPSEILYRGSIYGLNNFYNNNNPNNPYSPYQNPYSPYAFRNNFDAYSAKVITYDGHFQGNISQQVNDPKGISNPYSFHGRVFNNGHPSNPYLPQKWNNPYSKFQRPYLPESVRNNPVYGVQYYDSNGNYIGSSQSQTYYNNDAVTIPYPNSPYESQHAVNPYDPYKRFN